MAYVYCDWGQYHLVFKIADKINSLYPGNYQIYNPLAMTFMGKKEFEKALESCERGLKIKDFHPLKKNKIEALISLDRIDDAFQFYKSSDILNYTFTDALINCGKYSEIHKYENGLSKDELLESFLMRCRYLNKKGWNHEEILEVCDEIFKIDNDNEIALEYKIPQLLYLDMDDEALKCSEDAIRLYPDNHRFYFYKAETLLWSFDDIDGAIRYYENGLSLIKDFEKVWPSVDNIIYALNKKADLYIKSGNYKKAIDMYDEILYYRPYEFDATDKIESIAGEHDIDYEPTQHFNESRKLRQKSRQRVKKIEDCLDAIEIGEYDDDYAERCSEFKDYSSIKEYIRDIIICLMETYPGSSEENARFLVKCHMEDINSSYEYKEPAAYASIDVGYCCG